ncbi:helix-turn-helix transcriptional regulator [Dehalogenimonas sp. THU2]|uniref:Helix-turn-helix transcriptional regulator n=1 Tax=Candidatus Dehalogenimonas loeffleri TaxID=3127115 RepID=A0ABZ2J9E6_9CHLR|nr:helix-turn-helix transcriptional regulator [Dehalogenimonas sp.]
MPDFGTYVRQLRKKQGLSLRTVSQQTGISYSYLSQIEQGRRNPPGPDLMKRLASVYQVTQKDLLRAAGYLEENNEPTLSDEQEVEMAFNYVMNDPRYKSGTRMNGKLTPEVKRFVVEMYEKATGKKLLPGSGA